MAETQCGWRASTSAQGAWPARLTSSIWLGGYPYEFALAEEIVEFCERERGMRAEKVLSVPPTGIANNQFVFRRVG